MSDDRFSGSVARDTTDSAMTSYKFSDSVARNMRARAEDALAAEAAFVKNVHNRANWELYEEMDERLRSVCEAEVIISMLEEIKRMREALETQGRPWNGSWHLWRCTRVQTTDCTENCIKARESLSR